MYYIYKITNDINDKLYIGKTTKSLQERFQEHFRDSQKARCEKRPLYNAIQKYGIEHFKISLIEECDIDQLSTREQYWIDFYDTYCNGYNATKGGDGTILFSHNEILQLLQQTPIISTKEIAQKIGCSINLVRQIANNNNIDLITRSNKLQCLEINQYDKNNNLIQTFESIKDAAQWCYDNKLSKGSLDTIRKKISGCLHDPNRKTAYGYQWKNNK